jgi:kanamycin kinase
MIGLPAEMQAAAGCQDRAPATVPAPVLAVAAGRQPRLAWHNEDALTYEVGEGTGRCFVKWSPATSRLDLGAEAERMTWAGAFHPVPRVLALGSDEEGGWLVTAALPGRSAVDPRWIAEPRLAVRAIGEGLRALHDTLPADHCPFSWMAELRVEGRRQAAAAGPIEVDPDWPRDHPDLTVDRALELVADTPPPDKIVVCHGDACAPNTLLSDDGRWSGHVDLGSLGIADRWADLAIATYSTGWNYGPGWESELLAAYGVPPDPDRTRYYRLLWDLGD